MTCTIGGTITLIFSLPPSLTQRQRHTHPHAFTLTFTYPHPKTHGLSIKLCLELSLSVSNMSRHTRKDEKLKRIKRHLFENSGKIPLCEMQTFPQTLATKSATQRPVSVWQRDGLAKPSAWHLKLKKGMNGLCQRPSERFHFTTAHTKTPADTFEPYRTV